MKAKPMSPFDPTIDAAFREYADLELRCYFLLMEGKENTPEIEVAEERMERLWDKLDKVQRQSLSGMGSDLNWVRRGCQPPPKGRKEASEVTETEQQELLEAIGAKEWHKVLHYLRLCAPKYPATKLAYIRGRVYENIGLSDYARVFYEVAADQEPTNTEVGLKALWTINKLDSGKAFQRAERIIALPLHYPAAVVAAAIQIFLNQEEAENRQIDRERFSRLLKDIVGQLPLEPSSAAQEVGYQAAACAFDMLSNPKEALRCIDEGIKLLPNSDDLWVFKGILLYDERQDEAVQVFERLRQRGTQNVFPFAFLAHYHLQKKNYGVSLELNREAWLRAEGDYERALLLEWQAICQAELGYPHPVVRSLFEQAMRLDPSDQRIAENLATFEGAVAGAHKPNWRIEDVPRRKWQREERQREFENVHAA